MEHAQQTPHRARSHWGVPRLCRRRRSSNATNLVDGANREEDGRYWVRAGLRRGSVGLPGHEDDRVESTRSVIYPRDLIVHYNTETMYKVHAAVYEVVWYTIRK